MDDDGSGAIIVWFWIVIALVCLALVTVYVAT